MTATARRVLAIVFVSATVTPVAAAAASGAPIRVTVPDCATPPLSFDAFLDSLRVELAAHDPPCCATGPEAPDGPAPLRIAVVLDRCAPESELHVAVEGPGVAAQLERRISLADVAPDGRPRALALSVAELVRSLEQRPAPPPSPPPPPTPGATPLDWQVTAAAALRVYPWLPTTLWGGRVGLTVAGTRWHAVLEVGGSTGRREVALGSLSVRTLGARLAAGPRFARGRSLLDLNAGIELGRASVDGETSIPGVQVRSGHDLVAALGVRLALETPIWGTLRLRAEAEGGETLIGFTGDVDGTPAAGVSGPYVSFALGVVVAGWQ